VLGGVGVRGGDDEVCAREVQSGAVWWDSGEERGH